jgi:ABC-type multidrug transport system ATPase subunit/ABC-type multidrug transport system permease subunit
MDALTDNVDQVDAGSDNAIYIRGLFARYNNNKIDALKNVNMTVKKGQVYVILGASGAGKSTLLKTIIGQVGGEASAVLVLGEEQLKRNQQIGYMPQVTGLLHDLSIVEHWESFGRFYGMSPSDIKLRTEFLLDFLALTSQANQLTKTLSGGQKQRTSFGIALMPSPDILILDEPMTGLDPVIREKLWQHLLFLSKRYGTTVIIASQFFETACDADVICLVHEGMLLIEESPRALVQNWNTLEDDTPNAPSSSFSNSHRLPTCEEIGNAYDNVCRRFEELQLHQTFDPHYRDRFKFAKPNGPLEQSQAPEASVPHMDAPGEWMAPMKPVVKQTEKKHVRIDVCKSIVKTHTRAYFRFLIPLLLVLIQPLIEVEMYSAIMGSSIKRLEIGIYSIDEGYEGHKLSDFTTSNFEKKNEYHIVRLFCEEPCESNPARQAVLRGDMLAAIEFKKRYSSRIITATDLQSDMALTLFLDTSAPIMASQVSDDLYHAFQETETYANRTSYDGMSFVIPVYGHMDSRFSEYLLGGVLGILMVVDGFVIGLAEMTKREEDETHTRYRVASVTSMEFVLGNMLGFCSLAIPQGIFALIFFSFAFGFPITPGIFFLLAIVVLGEIIVSMCMCVAGGLMVRNQFDSLMLMMLWFIPLMLLSGLFWPLEAQPYAFRWFSLILPTTWGASTFRAFVLKSLEAGLMSFGVHVGVCVVWILSFFSLSLKLDRQKTKMVEICGR